MNITIIFDSNTGNTEKMANAIAAGASKTTDVTIKKIGEAFPLTILTQSDAVIFGSPAIYASISNGMKDFLDCFEAYIKQNEININKKPAAVFGSYGWDGAWLMEEYLKDRVEILGFKVYDDVLVLVDHDIKHMFEKLSKKCEEFGNNFANLVHVSTLLSKSDNIVNEDRMNELVACQKCGSSTPKDALYCTQCGDLIP
jgi:flavorubredoxin/ribosomal protein L40E